MKAGDKVKIVEPEDWKDAISECERLHTTQIHFLVQKIGKTYTVYKVHSDKIVFTEGDNPMEYAAPKCMIELIEEEPKYTEKIMYAPYCIKEEGEKYVSGTVYDTINNAMKHSFPLYDINVMGCAEVKVYIKE